VIKYTSNPTVSTMDTNENPDSDVESVFSYCSDTTTATSVPDIDPVDAFIAAGLAWAAANRYTYSGSQGSRK